MFSLVIPTYNRAGILKRSMDHLLKLEGICDCEVIVVNDGSTDDTAAVLDHFRLAAPHLVKVLTLTNGGPARARNCGLNVAKNENILFIDDDVFPRPGMLQSHRRSLDEGYTGSQGLLFWHEDVAVTSLIRYIDSRGSQFAFDRVKDPSNLHFAFVYTGNFAVLRKAVREVGGFDQSFFNKDLRFSAFEDTILGYQLHQRGFKLALNRGAIADHLHDMDEDGYFSRECKVGYSIGKLQVKYPVIVRSLGLEKKDCFARQQAQLLQAMNSLTIVRHLVGYSLSMRLRHREAFYRGFVAFKQETAATLMRATQ